MRHRGITSVSAAPLSHSVGPFKVRFGAPSPQLRSLVLRYGVAVAAVVLSSAATSTLRYQFGVREALLAFTATIFVGHLGIGPGIVAIVLSALSIDYFFLGPYGQFGTDNPADFVVLAVFTVLGLVSNFVIAALRQGWLRSRQQSATLIAQLERANRERADFLRQTIGAQERERGRIARELHDSIGQYLVLLRFGISALERGLRTDPSSLQQLAQMKQQTSEVGEEVRRLAWELRPAALDELGLERAVAQFLEDWSVHSGVAVEFHYGLGAGRPAPETETTLYRVLQEAMTNVAKHADAERVSVMIETIDDHQIRMIIEDSGRGFNPVKVRDHSATERRFGLVGIRERVTLAGGSFEVEAAIGHGTHLFVTLPNRQSE